MAPKLQRGKRWRIVRRHTVGNANATAGFTSAMDLRAAAQNRRTTARANAQAKAHANAMAKDKANTNSVLNDPDD